MASIETAELGLREVLTTHYYKASYDQIKKLYLEILEDMNQNVISINDEYKNNKKFKDLLDIHSNYKTICSLASNIEGLKRQVGLHAAGMILSNDNLFDMDILLIYILLE